MNDYYWNENIKLNINEDDLITILKLNQKSVNIIGENNILNNELIKLYNAYNPPSTEIYISSTNINDLSHQTKSLLTKLVQTYNKLPYVLTIPIFACFGDSHMQDGFYSLNITNNTLYLYKKITIDQLNLNIQSNNFKIIACFINIELALALHGICGYALGMKETGYIMKNLKDNFTLLKSIFPPSQVFTAKAGLNLRKALLSDCLLYEV